MHLPSDRARGGRVGVAVGEHQLRAVGTAVLGLIGASVVLLVLAIASYPGGTSFDRSAPGHDLLRNFLCDLTAPVALNGAANPRGATLASLAILLLGVALILFWWTLAGVALSDLARSLVRSSAAICSIA